MTTIDAAQYGSRCTLTARGHATGKPEVCAAVSGILYALAGYLQNAARQRRSVTVYQFQMESGDAELCFCADEGARASFETAVIGLSQIAARYPECVEVKTSCA